MLFEDLSQLADGFRQRFNITDKLTLDDMIKLITPPIGLTIFSQENLRFSSNYNRAYTVKDGATITGTCFLLQQDMNNLDKFRALHRANDLIVKVHLWFVSTVGNDVTLSFDGGKYKEHMKPVVGTENTAELRLEKAESPWAYNIYFSGDAVIDRAKSYIVVVKSGGVVKVTLSTIKQFFVKRGVA